MSSAWSSERFPVLLFLSMFGVGWREAAHEAVTPFLWIDDIKPVVDSSESCAVWW